MRRMSKEEAVLLANGWSFRQGVWVRHDVMVTRLQDAIAIHTSESNLNRPMVLN
jgi:hypothetical protein